MELSEKKARKGGSKSKAKEKKVKETEKTKPIKKTQSTQTTNTFENHKIPSSIEQTVEIAKNIITALKKEANRLGKKSRMFEFPINRMRVYTKTKLEIECFNKYRSQINYKDWLRDEYTISNEQSIYTINSCQDIKDFLRLYYIEKREIPTLTILTMFFGKEPPLYERVLLPLKKRGFIWKQLPNTNKGIIIENPEQFNNRIEYLIKLKTWRDENRPILFVEVINLTEIYKLDRKTYLVAAVSIEHGLIDRILFHDDNLNIERWIERIVLEKLFDISHLIVIGKDPQGNLNEKRDSDVIKDTSSKKAIMQYLEQNNIPFNPEDHRAELYKLADIYSAGCRKNTIEYKLNLLKLKGHEIIEQPKGFMDLTFVYAKYLKKVFSETDEDKSKNKEWMKFVTKVLEEITLEEWQIVNERLRRREEEIFQEDMEMEYVLEKIMELAKYGRIDENDLQYLDTFTSLLGKNIFNQILACD